MSEDEIRADERRRAALWLQSVAEDLDRRKDEDGLPMEKIGYWVSSKAVASLAMQLALKRSLPEVPE